MCEQEDPYLKLIRKFAVLLMKRVEVMAKSNELIPPATEHDVVRRVEEIVASESFRMIVRSAIYEHLMTPENG